MAKQCLFSSLWLEPVTSSRPCERALNLLPGPAVPQYSTPNGTPQAAPETAPSDPRRKQKSAAIPSGLHAGERAVKPFGTSTNRTSSAANAARAGTTRSSRDGNRGFFQNPRPSDGPRRPLGPPGTLPVADAHAGGSDMPAGGDVPSPGRSPDTAAMQVAVTKAVPLPSSLRYSTAPADEGEKTTSRTPSRDKSADRNGPGLAAAAKGNHAEEGPRELLLPKVKSRQRSCLLRSGTPLNPHLLFISLGPA